jgi:integrase
MANRTASIIINAKIKDENGKDIGWRRGKVVISRNGQRKPGVMLYGGKEVPYSDGVFQIRHYDGDRLVYTTVGKEVTGSRGKKGYYAKEYEEGYSKAASLAEKLVIKMRREAENAILGIKPEPEPEEKKTLAELAEDYLTKKRSPSLELSYSAIHQYEQALNAFVANSKTQYVSDVTEQDITAFADKFKAEGYARKSIAMRYTIIRGFLAAHGVVLSKLIDTATHRKLASKPERHTEPYTPQELDKLTAASDPYHQMVWTLLLSSGMRMSEAMHLTWSNIDFVKNSINVVGEQRINRLNHGKSVVVKFATKTKRGRKVPLFPSLRTALQSWREQNPRTIYVVGTRSDLPNNHWLPKLKEFAHEAGIECGVCDGCAAGTGCEKIKSVKFCRSC